MSSFLISGIRLFDGENVTEKASVLVKDGFIADVGPNIQADGVPEIKKPGHTLLPGLIDGHAHPEGNAGFSEQAFRFGITTLMDMQNRSAKQQKQWAKERKDFPDIKSAHSGATIENGWPAAIIKKLSGPDVGYPLFWLTITGAEGRSRLSREATLRSGRTSRLKKMPSRI